MIKKVQSESGAKVQFKLDDGEGPDRMCSVTGPPEKVQVAANMIHDLINNAMVNILNVFYFEWTHNIRAQAFKLVTARVSTLCQMNEFISIDGSKLGFP